MNIINTTEHTPTPLPIIKSRKQYNATNNSTNISIPLFPSVNKDKSIVLVTRIVALAGVLTSSMYSFGYNVTINYSGKSVEVMFDEVSSGGRNTFNIMFEVVEFN